MTTLFFLKIKKIISTQQLEIYLGINWRILYVEKDSRLRSTNFMSNLEPFFKKKNNLPLTHDKTISLLE